MHVVFFSVLCENAYIPAMGFLSRTHSSCAFNIPFFKICQKGKVTFSLVISTAGKWNHGTSSTGLTRTLWPTDAWSSFVWYVHRPAVTDPPTLTGRKGRAQFLYQRNPSYPIYYFWILLIILARYRLSYEIEVFLTVFQIIIRAKLDHCNNRKHLFTGERLCFRTTMSTAIFRFKQKTCKKSTIVI